MQHNNVSRGMGAINQWRIIIQYANIRMLTMINRGNTYTHIAEAILPTGDESPPNSPTIVKMLTTNWRISIISDMYLFTASFPISFFYQINFSIVSMRCSTLKGLEINSLHPASRAS